MKKLVKIAVLLLMVMVLIPACSKGDDNNGGGTLGPNPPGGSNLTIRVNGVSFEMVYVEGGTFNMGAQSTDPDGQNYNPETWNWESPVHQVTLSSYYIGKFEVPIGTTPAVPPKRPIAASV